MKPNFALSLSFEGIRLLHRAAGGWRVVGDVALDAPDMSAELAVLRRTATALDPSGLRTKLLLPNAQIKYLTIDTKDMDTDARMDAARVALDGATPYAVADLAFDISADGTRTHVAAVARETLVEAEAFAAEHRFNPVSFAAAPDQNPYLGEPFFGVAASAVASLKDGDTIEPDGIAVVIIGDAQVTETPVVEALEPDAVEPVPAEAPEPEVSASYLQDNITADDEDQVGIDEEVAEPELDLKIEPTEDAQEPQIAPAKTAEPEVEEPDVAEDTMAALPSESEAAADAPEIAAPEAPAAKPDIPAPAVFKTGAVIEDTPPVEMDAPPQADPAKDLAEKSAQVVDVKPASQTQAEAPSDVSAESPAAKIDAPAPATDKKGIPVLPALGPASRAASLPKAPTPVAPSPVAAPAAGFASRRADSAPPAPSRREPVFTSGGQAPNPASVAANTATSQAPPKVAALMAATASAPIGRFLSRRKATKAAAIPAQPAMAATIAVPSSEAERMTVFGARRSDIGGKPRFLGLLLTAVLLVFLAGVAAWASVFLDDGLNLSRLFGDRTARVAVSPPADTDETDNVVTASLDPTLTPEDTAVLDALRDPAKPQTGEMSQRELEAIYATTGIWPQAPAVPPEPAGLVNIEDLYLTSIDPVSTSSDAVALPALASFDTDLPLASKVSPAAAGTTFAMDARGLVIPTSAGAVSPNGYTVYLGSPPLTPPATLARFQAVPQQAAPQDDAPSIALAAFRPKNRPGDLSETNERATLDGLTRLELAAYRPQFRPPSVQEQAKTAAEKAAAAAAALKAQDTPIATDAAVQAALAVTANTFQNATRLATKASARPDIRPRNFNRIVRRAQRTPQPQAETRLASTQTVAPRVVTPKIPTKTSVARQATVKNAINLRRVNLIGVYGKPSNRRALVRLGNGRYKKVTVGDRIDGGRVSAISENALRYSKRGRDVVLKMP